MYFGLLASRLNQVILEDDKDQQKELLREVQTLLQDAVPDDFDEWLEKQQAIKVKP